jgi:phytoene dehydrogenase-like protein
MPEIYDVFMYPNVTFRCRKGSHNFRDDLKTLFPQESDAIDQYFRDLRSLSRWMRQYVMAKIAPPVLQPFYSYSLRKHRALALNTTAAYLDRNFRSTELKAILVSQWGDLGLPPSESALIMQGLINNHYLDGGYFPKGGSSVIASSIQTILETTGGEIRVNHDVTEILFNGRKAVGVRGIHHQGASREPFEFRAKTIISDAGARITYSHLLPETWRKAYDVHLNRFPLRTAHLTLHLGLNRDPRNMGFQGENYWIFSDLDHDRMFHRRNEIISGAPAMVFLSFPSLKNPESKGHTAEIITFMDWEPFAAWARQPWKRRDQDYENLKVQLSDRLLQFVEERFPGFRDLVDYQELSTPLTTEHFTGHYHGLIYGLPATPERYVTPLVGPRTPYRHLYLTGADAAAGHGIAGALMGGMLTAGLVMGYPSGLKKILATILEKR